MDIKQICFDIVDMFVVEFNKEENKLNNDHYGLVKLKIES